MIEGKGIQHVDYKFFGAEIAKKRFRILAFILDVYIYAILAIGVGVLWGTPTEEEMLSYSFTGFPALGVFSLAFLLWPISEGLFGQTLGKRIVRLHVVTDDYTPITLSKAFGRFIIGIFDYICLIGLIVATVNKQNKRLGDLAAGTIVIRK